MPSGVYPRKNRKKQRMNLQHKYEFVLTSIDKVNHLIKLVKQLKKNRISKFE